MTGVSGMVVVTTTTTELLSNSPVAPNATTPLDVDSYDGQGAMLFIIAVILVYGIAVIGMLGFYNCSRGEQQSEDFDKQANRWLKEAEVRQRQFDIKSRKSVFARRLSELRKDLSDEHGFHHQSHVANYLIASIGMKSAGNVQPTRSTRQTRSNSDASSTHTSYTRSGDQIINISSNPPQTDGSIPITRMSNSGHVSERTPCRLPNQELVKVTSVPGGPSCGQTSVDISGRHARDCVSSTSGDSVFASTESSTVPCLQHSSSINKSRLISEPRLKLYGASAYPSGKIGANRRSNDDETGELLAEVYMVEYESVV